ncbi:hypothetical protein BTUL_0295g00030 [Botrytis tulipae]|uniref:Trichothecene 3-O-acetyltransferase-like N-terminal domain-containing protein n=1 Tax=Botrytis tulipae TaxID=87230 RepID=A0A4Z1E9Q1_9HELO|nr:hypothetical protein BTUL_0295g00030 [Botrytis tulipae]
MNSAAPGKNQNVFLDILGQQPSYNMYTQVCLCFPITDESSYSTIINTLTSGLDRLSISFPWIAGKVINEGSGKGNTGVYKIHTLQQTDILVVKDLRNESSIPSMDVLRRSNFPFSMLDENIVAPCKGHPGDQSASNPAPVFILQASLITGGIILTFVSQHQTMDMVGQGQIMYLLSKACHNELFTEEEVLSGNLPRHNLIPLLDDSFKPGPEVTRQTVKSTPSQPICDATDSKPPQPPPSPECTWAYFTFPTTSLVALKSLAKEAITGPNHISTDDALSAFIWQSVIRARLPRLGPMIESTFGRSVDVRSRLNIPVTYPGLMSNATYLTYTSQELVEEPLGVVASRLRSALNPATSSLVYDTRALATSLSSNPDKSLVSNKTMPDLSTDIMFSSWAKIGIYDLDFNLGLGKPEAVRRPRFRTVESMMFLMPRTLDGEITAAICLRNEDMKRLQEDNEFRKYGTYIG